MVFNGVIGLPHLKAAPPWGKVPALRFVWGKISGIPQPLKALALSPLKPKEARQRPYSPYQSAPAYILSPASCALPFLKEKKPQAKLEEATCDFDLWVLVRQGGFIFATSKNN